MGRAPCCDKDGLKKGPWTPEEDQKLVDYIQKHGPGNWSILPKKAGLQRCGKSCRLRWTNYLRPDIKRGRFSFEEEETIIQLHSTLGNKWSAIAARLPGRTDNEIKNHWNTHLRKKLLRMGIDPVTHSPRLDLLDFPSLISSLANPTLLNLLNLQTLLNPELLRLATSLACSQHFLSPTSPTTTTTTTPPSEISQQVGSGEVSMYSTSPQLVETGRETVSNFLTRTSPVVGNTVVQNPIDPNVQIIANHIENPTQNIPSFDGSDVNPNLEQNPEVKTGFQMDGQVILCPSSDNSAFTSNNNSNQSLGSSFSSVFSTPCSSSVEFDPLDSSLGFLDSSKISEDEIESYFGDMVKNFENPATLDGSCL